ncbi:MAG: SUMF1/EgtB/PvdO family nonheme iron enzyme [Candidatus Promineifilaceae bacterium]
MVAGSAATAIALEACNSGNPKSGSSVTVASMQSTPENTESNIVSTIAEPSVELIFPAMIQVQPGTFQMGSDGGNRFEKPVHTVIITRPFHIGIYAVTYEEYDKYSDDIEKAYVNVNIPDRGTFPVSAIDWYAAVEYCNWLSEKASLTPCYSGGGKATRCDFLANGYRLPTEAEWEFAARGGILSQGYHYSGSDDPDEIGWHAGNSGGKSHPVGEKSPNELGIYDMSGNRWEWCWDWFDADYYASSPEEDPTGPSTVPKGAFVDRSRRSSSAVQEADTLRVSYRSYDGVTYPGDNGLRLVISA